jgi:pilus assembly protein FimV
MDSAMPAAAAAGAASAEIASTDMAAASDIVDPIEEAQVYIDHGRDTQAEEILKEAINRDPQREDVQVKLLEVYAARGDKNGFNSVANGYHQLTAGIGDQWTKVAAMGYALDPSNTLYAGAADVEVPDMGADSDARSATVDLDLGTDQMGTTTDIELDAAPEDNLDKTIMISRAGLKPAAAEPEPGLPEFNLDLPPVTPPPAAEPAHSAEAPLDFNLDLPPSSAPAAKAEPAPAKTEDAGLDFKVDFSNIDLKLDDVAPAATAGAKDAHWNDVQQKFDLARAYQDMGDKDGAKEILREVIKEGDAQQQTEAQKLLESIK